MKQIVCLIFFQTVFGKHFLVEVENDPKKGNALSSVEKLEAELDDSLDEEEEEDKEMLETTKNGGKDYEAGAPYAKGWNSYARADNLANGACGGRKNMEQCKNIPDGTACKRGGVDSACCKGCCRQNGGRGNMCG